MRAVGDGQGAADIVGIADIGGGGAEPIADGAQVDLIRRSQANDVAAETAVSICNSPPVPLNETFCVFDTFRSSTAPPSIWIVPLSFATLSATEPVPVMVTCRR